MPRQIHLKMKDTAHDTITNNAIEWQMCSNLAPDGIKALKPEDGVARAQITHAFLLFVGQVYKTSDREKHLEKMLRKSSDHLNRLRFQLAVEKEANDQLNFQLGFRKESKEETRDDLVNLKKEAKTETVDALKEEKNALSVLVERLKHQRNMLLEIITQIPPWLRWFYGTNSYLEKFYVDQENSNRGELDK